MKKLLLFVAVAAIAFSLNSCSNSSSDGTSIGGKIVFKIGNQNKTFDRVEVTQDVFNGGTAEEYTELTVVGTNNSSSESVSIFLNKNDLGTEAVTFFGYDDGQDLFADQNDTFTINVTTNNDSKKLKGTFSGVINGPANGSPIGISNGSFDIQY